MNIKNPCPKPVKIKTVNPKDKKADPFSGFIIIRLNDQYAYAEGEQLEEVAKKYKMTSLSAFLAKYKSVPGRRVVVCFPVKKIADLERKVINSKFRPLHSLTTYWRLDFGNTGDDIESILKELNGLREISLAYRERTVTDPAVDDSDDTYATSQDYLDAAPGGIDARWAWTQPDSDGAGVGFVDLEQGWIPTHEDLTDASPTLIYNVNRDGVGTYVGNHGTSVLGEVIGVDNDFGIIGIAPNVDYVKMTSHFDGAVDGNVADAIVAAIPEMNAGDVLLLEVQKDLLPTETDDADFDAIRLAVAHGIVVVEAAGNGDNDLDLWTDSAGNKRLNRTDPDFEDSGAIMVGASISDVPHERADFSNYGSRIDVYAWGENITTSGYGDLAGAYDTSYTSGFSGTSGASPMIVGAALIIQGMYKASAGTVLSPLQMRSLLSDPATGTPQGTTVAGNIGVMPDLRSIIEDTLGLVPDVYLRDYVGDTGLVPHSGSISASPDIIVLPDAVIDPTASFGEGSGTEGSSTLGSTVEAGQENFIYVRMKNRGSSEATDVTATVYWSEVATLLTPDMWNLIGTSGAVTVPVGDTLVVADAITWLRDDIPASGHYCFVGILDAPRDGAPPIPGSTSFDWDDFYAFIRNHNNVTWRNFNVEDALPDPSADPSVNRFLLTGTPDKSRYFDFEIIRQLPREVEAVLEVPRGLFDLIKGEHLLNFKEDKKYKTVSIYLPSIARFHFCNVLLPKGAKFRCTLKIYSKVKIKTGRYAIAISQKYQCEEVGRITWAFDPYRKQ